MLLAMATIAGCKGNTNNEPSPPPSSPVPEQTAGAKPTAEPARIVGDPWVGKWVSPSCGERVYPRWLTIEADGELTIQERICPSDEVCDDPEIVTWRGRWKQADHGIAIEMTDFQAHPKTKAPPSRLSWQAGPDLLVGRQGDTPCPYGKR